MKIESRFLKYISFDTQSSEESTTSPSTDKQKVLGEFLAEEMRILKLQDVMQDEYGIVYGTIPGNTDQGDVIGFIAHMDTSPDASGENVSPQIIRNYNGQVITINDEKKMYLDPEEYPELKDLIHHDIITTDGTTLLGADDKAGIAIIMSVAEYMYRHPEFKHNDIKIAFTCDEEVGRGTEHFNIERFNADYAYTVDGGDINQYNFENFNAYKAVVRITGQSFHTGDAKGKMVNALTIARNFDSMLGEANRPETTEGYDGFYHLYDMHGDVASATLTYLLREHDMDKMHKLMERMSSTADYLNTIHDNSVEIEYVHQYDNMKDIMIKVPHIVEQIDIAMRDLGMDPRPTPIRGGTDGAMLSYKGLPCPNLGTGGYNYHGEYEYASLTQMKKGVELILRMIKNNVEA